MKRILQSIESHTSIRALALMVECCDSDQVVQPSATGSDNASDDSYHESLEVLDETLKSMSIPELSVLYIKIIRWPVLERLSIQSSLQVLAIGMLEVQTRDCVTEAVRIISNCQHLKTICLQIGELYEMSDLLTIAIGCRELRRFDVSLKDAKLWDEQMEAQLSELLKATPHLEILSTNVPFKLSSSGLKDAAEYCPQLLILDLRNGLLILSQDSLTRITPFKNLRALYIRKIFFAKPQKLRRFDKIQQLSKEWTQVFPCLQHIPCITEADIFDVDMIDLLPFVSEHDEAIEEYDESDMMANSTSIQGEYWESAWFNLTEKLWKCLQYENDDELIAKTKHMWQTKFEMQLLGWPVLSLDAYLDPHSHSTSKSRRSSSYLRQIDPPTPL